PRPARGGSGPQHEPHAGALAGGPAAGLAGDASPGRKPRDRAAQEHGAGLADHDHRAHFLRAAAARRVPAQRRDLLARAGPLFRGPPRHHRGDAPPRAPGRPPVRAGGRPMIFDWGYALEIAPVLARALLVTLQATALGMAIALVLGFAL